MVYIDLEISSEKETGPPLKKHWEVLIENVPPH
jgi:hypothetical protein